MKSKIKFVVVIVLGIVLATLLAIPKLIANAENKDDLAARSNISISIGVLEAPRSLQIRGALPDRLDRYLDQLALYECRDCGAHYSRLDSNSLHSYSCLQFQRATWNEMVRRFGTPSEQARAKDPDSIYDCDFQKEIARRMFEYDARWASHHWQTSIYDRGLGLPNTD